MDIYVSGDDKRVYSIFGAVFWSLFLLMANFLLLFFFFFGITILIFEFSAFPSLILPLLILQHPNYNSWT